MAELDMVINGLTCCINHNDCKKCPYANEYDTTFDCIDRTRKDALELLKEQKEREKCICKEICDFIRSGCSTDTYEDQDYVCDVIQKIFIKY